MKNINPNRARIVDLGGITFDKYRIHTGENVMFLLVEFVKKDLYSDLSKN